MNGKEQFASLGKAFAFYGFALASTLAGLCGCGPGDGSSGMQATETADAGGNCQSSNPSAAAP